MNGDHHPVATEHSDDITLNWFRSVQEIEGKIAVFDQRDGKKFCFKLSRVSKTRGLEKSGFHHSVCFLHGKSLVQRFASVRNNSRFDLNLALAWTPALHLSNKGN